MNTPAFSQPLRGIVPPLVTPLAARDELDRAALARIIERMIEGGVAGIFVLGTTGEAPALDYRLRYELVEAAAEIIAGRVPMLVGVTDPSLTESLDLAQHAAANRAAAIVAAPPYYFPLQQRDLVRYFSQLAEQSPLPLFLYNMPACVKIDISVETTEACTRLANVCGVKDSGGNLEHYRRLLELRSLRPDWTFLIGPEHLLAESVLLGGDGGVNGGANLHPRLFVDWFAAAVANDSNRIHQLGDQVRLLGQIYRQADEFMAVVRGLKCALSVAGLCDNRLAEPIQPCDAVAREKIVAIVEQLGLLAAASRT
ncbi:putative 2-keto-3-deoxy-galactonate aldolase YagE [Anatilimnocola aggregata]|uniref:Putative 2-keto-3-deoxy-galactonate aldolase YagE n=1 Tax=Anatilimnocola aggregata TaxID=2528021 RepID=A0A517YBL3_9BACT|nr:dihydrodipicolinate synthase family protein [Anatilimnocola aggregata]QDU27643.1 putative 2-keto-3-deoxy-galactonate aldolase YagE [Anatilimnocola aggregata]